MAKSTQQSMGDHAKKAGARQLTPEEEEELDAKVVADDEGKGDEGGADDGSLGVINTPEDGEGPPPWAMVPEDLKMPPDGKVVTYIRFRAAMTDYKSKGDRQCIIWNLTYADEKLAHKRCHGEPLRSLPEMTRAMIRAVDGKKVNWANPREAGGIDAWWDEIGAKCRSFLQAIYLRGHNATDQERVDFFGNCVVETSSR
jgi:hypothetical protein